MEVLIHRALDAREELFRTLHAEGTDTYRLFHGVNEGRPGLTIDRYGGRILIQNFHQPISDSLQSQIIRTLSDRLSFQPVFDFKDRTSPDSKDRKNFSTKPATDTPMFSQELGIQYQTRTGGNGLDPYLFLDTRALRRRILKQSRGLSVLNLFAYTCSLGLSAARGGAAEVWNIDFSKSALNVGETNFRENRILGERFQFIAEDFFPAVRQLAGLPVKGRASRSRYKKFRPKLFDLVFLDPPRWATSRFGAVDLVSDYQSLFKPVLFATKPGGVLICTNHVPSVNLDDWLEILERCAKKAGAGIRVVTVIPPESDFPSPDLNHPLKVAVIDRLS